MTWFEAEQIDTYLKRIENSLENWSLDSARMRMEQSELDRLYYKLQKDVAGQSHPSKSHFIRELIERIETCEEHIHERLKR